MRLATSAGVGMAAGSKWSGSGVADDVGRCVLVFAFAPTLVTAARWLAFEATNVLNSQNAVVLAFLPVRGVLVALDAFRDGALQGIGAGLVCGVLARLWRSRRDTAPQWSSTAAVGALLGIVAAGVMLAATVPLGLLEPGRVVPRGGLLEVPTFAPLRMPRTIPFELAAGMLCGLIAVPTLGREPRVRGLVPILQRSFAAACLTVLVVLIGVRWLRYTPWSASPSVDHALRELMVIDEQLFLYVWAWSTVMLRTMLLAAAVVLIALHRRLLARDPDATTTRWRLTPLTLALASALMLWLHWTFDVTPVVAVVCAVSLLLVSLLGRDATPLPRAAVTALWIAFFLAALLMAGDAANRLAIAAWVLVLLGTALVLGARLRTADLAFVRMLAVMPINLLPAILPLVVPLHAGTRLADGFAYSFCEAPGGRLFAAIPECDTPLVDYQSCRTGTVAEYDLATMTRVAGHQFFSPTFYGRLEQLACIGDEVQVAVQGLVYQGRKMVQGVLRFPRASPTDFTVLSTEGGIGTAIAYDQAHDAVFYSGEFANPLIRYDRRTRQFDPAPGQALLRPWIEPVSLQPNTASLGMNTISIHPGRNRLYVTEWMQGRDAYAVDLDSLQVVARYDVGGGGAMAVSVDPGRDRLFVGSMWGLEIYDLATDTLITRIRTGPGNRPLIVDAARNRLYVSSMVEGKIRVLDRDTLRVIGQIPIGFGSRYLHLSDDGKRLFASSKAAHYYWDPDTLLR